MSDKLLTNLMHFALRVTGAKRGMALDTATRVVAFEGLTEEDIAKPGFTGFDNVIKAYTTNGKPYLTNNMVLDPAEAPTTNTMFTDLRLVVVFPLAHLGAIYIDQPIRDGVLEPDMLDQVQRFVVTWASQQQPEQSVDDMVTRFGS